MSNKVKQKDISEYLLDIGIYFLLSGIGGSLCCGISHLLLTPLDLVKCRMQSKPEKYSSIKVGFKVTKKEDGYIGFTRGWLPLLIGYSLQGFCKFGFYDTFKRAFGFSGTKQDFPLILIYLGFAAVAEFIACILLAPMESVKVKMQTDPDYGKTMKDTTNRIREEGGCKGFYKILVPLWCRQIPFTMIKFASFEQTRILMNKYAVSEADRCKQHIKIAVSLTSGLIAGVLCALGSHPADTIISKINITENVRVIDALKQTKCDAFWRGLLLRIIMVGLITCLQWGIYDTYKIIFSIPRSTDPSPGIYLSHKAVKKKTCE